MFDPNYVPDLVDVVLAMDVWFIKEGEIYDFPFKEAIVQYKKASKLLGLELRPRIVREEEIIEASVSANKAEDLNLSADTVLFIHGSRYHSGSQAAAALKKNGLRMVIIYDPSEFYQAHEERAKILGLDDSSFWTWTPEQQICTITKMEEEHNLYPELLRCEGRVLEYFKKLAALRGGK